MNSFQRTRKVQSQVLIVSKTRMANDCVCIGGIDTGNKKSVRLMNEGGYHDYIDDCPFNIREVWNIAYSKNKVRSLPHSEDIEVISKEMSYVLDSEKSMLDFLIEIQFNVYQGSIFNTFEGKLKCTDSGTFYISEDDVPNNSTCFWICDSVIRRDDYNDKIRYNYNDGNRTFRWGHRIAYVGLEDNPAQIIQRGTLVRLSLAHWWAPEDSDTEERCYLQLSGWYE